MREKAVRSIKKLIMVIQVRLGKGVNYSNGLGNGERPDWNRLGGVWTGSMVWIRTGESDRGMIPRYFFLA